MRLLHRAPPIVDALDARAFIKAELAAHSAANTALRGPHGPLAAQDAQIDELVCLAARALPQGAYGRFLVLAYTHPAPDIDQVREALCWELEQLRQRAVAQQLRRAGRPFGTG